MENIEELLRVLSQDAPEEQKEPSQEQSGGLFDALDPEMLIGLMGLFEKMNSQDDNERFLLALKPLLREENRTKVDTAVRFLKLYALLPMLKDSGILNSLF